MKRILLALVFALFGGGVAHATTCTIPNTFVAGTAALASQVNGNFTSLQSCGNNIDHANIGSGGVYASQIIPDNSAHATFGGAVAYTFSNGVNVSGGFNLNSGDFVIPAQGTATSGGNFGSAGYIKLSSSVWNGSVAVTHLWQYFTDPGGGLDIQHNGTAYFQISTTGQMYGPTSITSGGTVSGQSAISTATGYYPPMFTSGGATAANTVHGVIFSGTFPASTSNCGPFTGYYCNTVAVNSAVWFSSASSWDCGGTISGFVGAGYYSSQFMGSGFIASNDGHTFYIASNAGAFASTTYHITCFGT